MIVKTKSFLDELSSRFPDVDKNAIERICDKGMFGLMKEFRRGEDVLVEMVGRQKSMFYTPRSPEEFKDNLKSNIMKRKIRDGRKQQIKAGV